MTGGGGRPPPGGGGGGGGGGGPGAVGDLIELLNPLPYSKYGRRNGAKLK